LPAFFVFGLLAGMSSCAALVGGLILSISKQWNDLYDGNHSTTQKMAPHIMFNIGRLVSYAFLGAVLGLIGSKLQISLTFTSVLVFAVSILMISLGLQMLGVQFFQKFQIALPRFFLRYVADESNFKGKYLPFVMGALTFFLPCGFTITAQGVALLSGSAISGALIMLFFALGTLPVLLLIGYSSVKFSKEPTLSYKFSKVAGNQ
jgi:sulfite exporter TauE/SafE